MGLDFGPPLDEGGSRQDVRATVSITGRLSAARTLAFGIVHASSLSAVTVT
jgi:hypothetical protein